jgi:glycosyltransferase involved in cell wall biosynthesis
MRVSIITVCYNSAASIAHTIASVKNQCYNNIEHIIIDGKSTDNTISVIEKCNYSGILISEKDNGIYDAMNKGLQMATGDIIGILNSDDFYADSNVIEDVVERFSASHSDALYGDLVYINENNRIIRNWRSGEFHNSKFHFGWMPPHPTVFIKKEIYSRLGNFNTDLKISADYELMLRFLFINKTKTTYLPRVLVKMKAGGASNDSLKSRLKAHKEDYLAWTSNGIIPRWYTVMLKPLRKVLQYNHFTMSSVPSEKKSPPFKNFVPSP